MGKLILPEGVNPAWYKDYIDNYWLGLGSTLNLDIVNPFTLKTSEDIENPHLFLLDMMRKPEWFFFTCKNIFNKTLAPFQLAILRELWIRPFPMLIASRGAGKSFLLGLYAVIRATFCQGSKIVIVGAAFRQSKGVFDYCQDVWDNAPILQDLAGNDRKNGPRRDVDRCSLRIGESIITAIPLGTGEKVRGLRSNVTLADEMSYIPIEIFETVVRGFGAVSMDPVIKLQREARLEAMRTLGMYLGEEESSIPGLMSNQTVCSGTPSYSFNHFYDYWRRYKAIVESKGDVKKLQDIFNGEIPDKFNWKDYSVIRIPYHLIPKGFMDEKQIAQAKATVHVGIYQMEYGACGHFNTMVITDCGVKKLGRVLPGDMVLTHRGRFRKVNAVTCRKYYGEIIHWKTLGCNRTFRVTGNHQFLVNGEWVELNNLSDKTYLANLKELNEQRELDLTEIVSDYMETACGRIYPRHGQSKLTREQVAYVRQNCKKESQTAIAKKCGVSIASINNQIHFPKVPKNSIPGTIPLDYDFGLIVGYYASEGSTGADGRAVVFTLDGHVNQQLEFYVRELSDAIQNVFGFYPKHYRCDAFNTLDVTINQRLLVGLFKYICPGVSHTKFVRPEILYSNEDFLKGFIVGYWNGDGYKSDVRPTIMAGCVNHSLLSQVRVGLSYFNVSSSLLTKKRKASIIRGKSYNCKRPYVLSVYGEDERRFRRLFYNEDCARVRSCGVVNVTNDGNQTSFRLVKKEPKEYDGFVYNLHVEEDESYSFLNATVHNCFASDSNGFFKRSLVESCVVGKTEKPIAHTCGEVHFTAVLRGQPNRRYVIGVDPASENDNFSIIVLECWEDHRRIVHCWTTNRSRFKAQQKHKLTEEQDYYGFAARRIREIIRLFPTERIALDSQGGGVAVMEALGDSSRLKPGERPIHEVVDPEKPKDSDGMPGDHLVEIINFAKADWVSEANHGMRKDFEDKVLLFPAFDSAVMGLAIEEDKLKGRVKVDEKDSSIEKLYDTLEDCVLEIEDLKDELASIVHTQTGTSMRDRWDTPTTKAAGGKKGRLRKDRYSSLVMANMIGRILQRTPTAQEYVALGGFANAIYSKREKGGEMYTGPDWYVRAANEASSGYGSVNRHAAM